MVFVKRTNEQKPTVQAKLNRQKKPNHKLQELEARFRGVSLNLHFEQDFKCGLLTIL